MESNVSSIRRLATGAALAVLLAFSVAAGASAGPSSGTAGTPPAGRPAVTPPSDPTDVQGWLAWKQAEDLPALPHAATLLYRLGHEARKRGDLETAVRLWRGAEELDPTYLAPRLTLAAHFLSRDPAQGLIEVGRVVGLARTQLPPPAPLHELRPVLRAERAVPGDLRGRAAALLAPPRPVAPRLHRAPAATHAGGTRPRVGDGRPAPAVGVRPRRGDPRDVHAGAALGLPEAGRTRRVRGADRAPGGQPDRALDLRRAVAADARDQPAVLLHAAHQPGDVFARAPGRADGARRRASREPVPRLRRGLDRQTAASATTRPSRPIAGPGAVAARGADPEQPRQHRDPARQRATRPRPTTSGRSSCRRAGPRRTTTSGSSTRRASATPRRARRSPQATALDFDLVRNLQARSSSSEARRWPRSGWSRRCSGPRCSPPARPTRARPRVPPAWRPWFESRGVRRGGVDVVFAALGARPRLPAAPPPAGAHLRQLRVDRLPPLRDAAPRPVLCAVLGARRRRQHPRVRPPAPVQAPPQTRAPRGPVRASASPRSFRGTVRSLIDRVLPAGSSPWARRWPACLRFGGCGAVPVRSARRRRRAALRARALAALGRCAVRVLRLPVHDAVAAGPRCEDEIVLQSSSGKSVARIKRAA